MKKHKKKTAAEDEDGENRLIKLKHHSNSILSKTLKN